MNRNELISLIQQKQNYLCIGLDTDIDKIPAHLFTFNDPVFEFNKAIIDATKAHCISYKINTAFYEAMGVQGWHSLQKTVEYIPDTHFVIADAKRGDIGNTSAQYARAFFETYGFDAVTVAPYMGQDSLQPFLEYTNKWTIVLALTSNKGSEDFEQLQIGENGHQHLYEAVMTKVASWGSVNNLMFVVGATKAGQLATIRKSFPEHFFLVPGIGTQGGDLSEVSIGALTPFGGLLINVSRAVIYAAGDETFAEKAGLVASQYALSMKALLNNFTNR